MGENRENPRGDLCTSRRGIDKDEFWHFVKKYESRLFNFVNWLCKDEPDPGEIAIIAILYAYHHRHEFNPERGAFNTWLWRHAKYAALERRKELRAKQTISIEADYLEDGVVDESGLDKQLSTFLDHAEFNSFLTSGSLSPEERAAMERLLAKTPKERIMEDLCLTRRKLDRLIKTLQRKWKTYTDRGGADD